jgi:hypothetical protein
MLRTRRRCRAILLLCLAAACKDAGSPIQVCTTANAVPIALAVGDYANLNAGATTSSGCFLFVANTGAGQAEFLVVPQAATAVPGRILNFVLQAGTEPVAAPPSTSADVQGRAPRGAGERFHEFLRRGEEARRWGSLVPRTDPAGVGGVGGRGGAPGVSAAAPAQRPPVVGDRRVFNVLSDFEASPPAFQSVVARARAVGQRVAIYVDSLAPPPGLSLADLDTLVTVFDSRLYPIDTAAFGRESDINQDQVVIVLMTNVVNRLVTAQECPAGFVAGFFLGADIDPFFRNDQRFNHAEVFYTLVADPGATLSCAHSVAQLKRLVPITFIHEFQHMISFNQHVLVRSEDGEVLWLNEGLSHYAEELGGRSYLAENDTVRFREYVAGDLLNGYQFLENPGAHSLSPKPPSIGTLAERGAEWLYVRYLIDQYAAGTTRADWDAFTRQLVLTSRVGEANVEAATGVPFAESVARWALANFVENLDTVPGFSAPPVLQYRSWNLRSEYRQLYLQDSTRFRRAYPLIPTTGEGSLMNMSGTLRAGSGLYHLARQPAGAPMFLVRFRAAADGWVLAESHAPRLNVIRIR